MQHSHCLAKPSCPFPVASPAARFHSENQIQTHISQHSVGDCHNLSLASLADVISSDSSPFHHHPATLTRSRLHSGCSLCLILFLHFLTNPALSCGSMSNQHVLFSKMSSLITFGKVVPSSQPFQSLPSFTDYYKKLLKMIYLLFDRLSTPLEWTQEGGLLTRGWLSGKESNCQCRRCGKLRFSPWVGKIPWRRAWQPTPVLLPGKSHGQRSLAGYSSWGCKELDVTKRLRDIVPRIASSS